MEMASTRDTSRGTRAPRSDDAGDDLRSLPGTGAKNRGDNVVGSAKTSISPHKNKSTGLGELLKKFRDKHVLRAGAANTPSCPQVEKRVMKSTGIKKSSGTRNPARFAAQSSDTGPAAGSHHVTPPQPQVFKGSVRLNPRPGHPAHVKIR
jgi:hypothetical protein